MRQFFLSFVRGKAAILTVIGILLTLSFYAGRYWMNRQAEIDRHRTRRPLGEVNPKDAVDKAKAPAETTVARDGLVPLPAVPRPPALQALPPAAPPAPVASLALYEAPPAPSPAPKAELVKAAQPDEPRAWLARGVKIPCILLNNLESSWSMDVPVQAEVSRNVYQVCDGVRCLIIPAGTLVSCWATPGAVRDRIQVKGRWSFVYQRDGREATVEGVAAMRQAHPDNLMFGPEDSTPGLQGDIIETDHWAAAKAAVVLILEAGLQTGQTALAALAQAPRTGLSIQVPDTSVIRAKYLDQLVNGQQGEGRYVRVPVGTEFYVITASVLRPLSRGIGGDQDQQANPINAALPNLQSLPGLQNLSAPKNVVPTVQTAAATVGEPSAAGVGTENPRDEASSRYHY